MLAAVGLFILYFVGLGSYPLIDPDEPVYGQVAKEMASGAGWLTPHYAGQPWFDKPPLFYWLSGASAVVFGPDSAVASRLPSALAAVGLVLLVYALASYDLGRRAGVMAAVVMATCLQQIVLAHAAVTDMTFVLCLTAALYAYRRWLDSSGSARYRWAALCGAATGLAMLTKGPVAPVLLGSAIVVHLLWSGRVSRLMSGDAALAAGAAVAVGVPWYAAMYAIHGDRFVEGFLVANNISRFLKPEHAEQTGNWFSYFRNVPVLLMFFFPWSVFLPQAIMRGSKANEGLRLALIWSAVVFFFFSASKTQLVTYIFPMYPAAAALVGSLWSDAVSLDAVAVRSVRRGLWVGCVLAVVLGVVMVFSAQRKVPEAEAAAILLAVTLVAGVVAALLWVIRSPKRPADAAWILGTGMVLLTLELMLVASPIIGARVSSQAIVRSLHSGPGATIAELDERRPSLLFYLGSWPRQLRSVDEASRLLAGGRAAFVICGDDVARELAHRGGRIVSSVGGRAVVANSHAALDRKGLH